MTHVKRIAQPKMTFRSNVFHIYFNYGRKGIQKKKTIVHYVAGNSARIANSTISKGKHTLIVFSVHHMNLVARPLAEIFEKYDSKELLALCDRNIHFYSQESIAK